MPHLSIQKLKQDTGSTAVTATIDVQLQQATIKTTKGGKPYLQVSFADATDQFSLKIWENLPQFETIQQLSDEAFIRLEGDWLQNQYGIESPRWQYRLLNEGEIQDFLLGDPETKQSQTRDWEDILKFTQSIQDPRLHALCLLFFEKHQSAFLRTAAARKNHHARRGGLVEHVAQMMRAAIAISSVYKDLNQELLIAGILFHDCGKLWENTYPENGFSQPFDLEGEMLGHIPLGLTLVSDLWQELMLSSQAAQWSELSPSNANVRIHLLHLIASHHGSYEFGSPTLPRTPEAHALHHIDNLDAKYEMLKQAYLKAPELAPGIQEKQFPLPANLVKPLAKFNAEENTTAPLVENDPLLEIENDLEAKPFDGELF